MRPRPVVTIPLLVISVILTLSLRAQQKNVGPSSAGPRPNAVRPYVACAAAVLTPPGARQERASVAHPPFEVCGSSLDSRSCTRGQASVFAICGFC